MKKLLGKKMGKVKTFVKKYKSGPKKFGDVINEDYNFVFSCDSGYQQFKSMCTPCEPGFYSPAKDPACHRCAKDTYQESYLGARSDGSAWEMGGSRNRVFRGGSLPFRAIIIGHTRLGRCLLVRRGLVDNLFRALGVHLSAPNPLVGPFWGDRLEYDVRSMGTGPQVSRVTADFFG